MVQARRWGRSVVFKLFLHSINTQNFAITPFIKILIKNLIDINIFVNILIATISYAKLKNNEKSWKLSPKLKVFSVFFHYCEIFVFTHNIFIFLCIAIFILLFNLVVHWIPHSHSSLKQGHESPKVRLL